MFAPFKARTAFRNFATRTVGDAVKATVTGLAAATVASPTGAAVLGVVSKGLVETLLEQGSRTEKKLDRLLREPLLSGLLLLKQALVHGSATEAEDRARDNLLEHAHVSLTRALALVGDSREDSLFVKALDCVALASHKGHRSLAERSLIELRTDLALMRSHVELLEKEASEWVHDSQVLYDYFARDPLGDKPFGHMELRLLTRWRKDAASRVQLRADEAREHLNVLEGIISIAETLVGRADAAIAL